jgi:hypothetical protein
MTSGVKIFEWPSTLRAIGAFSSAIAMGWVGSCF